MDSFQRVADRIQRAGLLTLPVLLFLPGGDEIAITAKSATFTYLGHVGPIALKAARKSCARLAPPRRAPPVQIVTVLGAIRPSPARSCPDWNWQIPSAARRDSDRGDGRRGNSARSDCAGENR